MKIKITWIALLFSINGLIQAQVSKEDFKRAVDYVNCKTIELSLKKDTANYKTYLGECPCKNTTYIKISNFLNSMSPKLDATISLSDEIKLIKNKYDGKKTSQEVIKYLSETIFNDRKLSEKLFKFSENHKSDGLIAEIKSQIKGGLTDIVSASEKKKEITVPDTTQKDTQEIAQASSNLEARLSTLENKINDLESDKGTRTGEEKKGWFGGFTFQIDILTLIISLIIMFIILKLLIGRLNDGEVSDEVKKYVKDNIPKNEMNSSANSGANSNEVRRLKDDIESLKLEIKQLKTKPPIEVVQQNNDQKSFQENRPTELKTQAEIFFLSSPNSDGSFNESSSLSSYKEGASVYKFTKVSAKKATFQIDEREASVKLALQYPSTCIDPVCEALNAFNQNAKRIITDMPGEVELVNDKWIKNIKAKIRYE